MKRHINTLDYPILFIVLALLAIGFIILNSASAHLGQSRFDDPFYYVKRQALFGFSLGVALFLTGVFVPYGVWKKFAPLAFFVTIALLILVFIPPLEREIKGVHRWLSFGSFTVQPSEFLKLSLVAYLALLFEKQHWHAASFMRGFIPFITLLALIGGLIFLQPDAGTFIIIAISAFIIYIFAGAKLHYIGLLALLGGLALWGMIVVAPYRYDRIRAFLEPSIDPAGISYQITKSVLFVGSGSLFGTGLGQNPAHYQNLPEAMTDSIFAVAAKELGFIGASLIIFLFIFFAFRGFTIAKNAPDTFGKLTAAGITSFITIQALVNVGAIIGVLPLTGIPLPLMSYGGSSLMTTLFALGILLNISKRSAPSRYAQI